MGSPYETLPSKSFWRTAVAEKRPRQIEQLWDPKFDFLPIHKISTMGSCFAQHFSSALLARNYRWFDAESAPHVFAPETARKYNYGVFSARTGNIYTTKALKQWIFWALGLDSPPDEIWVKDGRCYDPFRPAIEPGGFATAQEMFDSRLACLAAIRRMLKQADRFVFTLGLTEGWINRAGGFNYAVCPGTAAGEFDPDLHVFHNFGFAEILTDLTAAIDAIRAESPHIRFLLTVSPVPLVATASDKHVLTATSYSKSVLRAVAGEHADAREDVDYFPSYEIITAPAFKGRFYEANLRSVRPAGVNFVMKTFFSSLHQKFGASQPHGGKKSGRLKQADRPVPGTRDEMEENGVVCEEQMLEAFAR